MSMNEEHKVQTNNLSVKRTPRQSFSGHFYSKFTGATVQVHYQALVNMSFNLDMYTGPV